MRALIRDCIAQIKPYEPGKPIEEVERELGLTDVIKLASNENALGPSPLALQALSPALEKIHIYPDGYSYHLRQALAEHLGVGGNNLILGNGTDEVLKMIAEAFLGEGEEAIAAHPSFYKYTTAAQLMGGLSVRVPLTSDLRHDLPAMADQLTDRTKIIFICNPNNPTGTYNDREEVEKLLDTIPQRVLVVFDEAYYEYVESPVYPQTLDYVRAGRKNVIVLRTFSKIYGLAALRVGYGIADSEVINWIERTREPFNVNTLGQVAARAALGDTTHVARSRQVNAAGKRYIYARLKEMGLDYVPSEANFIFFDCKVDSRRVFDAMLRRGVIVRTGDIFGLATYIRLTIGTAAENKRAMDNLEQVLTSC